MNDYDQNASQTGYPALSAAATPDMYRRNAFRVTGLPVDASSRDVTKQGEKLKMLEKLGGLPPVAGPFALDPAPDQDALRDAVDRLRDPEKRLVDELFWFWPRTPGQGNADPALANLAAGSIEQARADWLNMAGSPDDMAVGIHNLAVLAHLGALEAPEGAGPDGQAARWNDAFRFWKGVYDLEAFWLRLQARVAELNDPRLHEGVVWDIRDAIPEALVSVNAKLARRAAERGDLAEAARHSAVIQHSGVPPAIVNDALRAATDPIKERIRTLCATAEPEADDSPTTADTVTRRLIEQTRPLLDALDAMLPPDHPTRETVHDDVATRALGCLISFANTTENWRVTEELAEMAIPLAASESVRMRLTESLDIIRKNRAADVYKMCWFCNERPTVASSEAKMYVHGDVTSYMSGNVRHTNWKYTDLFVPRCAECQAQHQREVSWSAAGGVLGVVAWFVLILGLLQSVFALFLGALPAMWLGTCIGYYLCERYAKVKTQPNRHKFEFPPLKAIIEKGWRHGERPDGNQGFAAIFKLPVWYPKVMLIVSACMVVFFGVAGVMEYVRSPAFRASYPYYLGWKLGFVRNEIAHRALEAALLSNDSSTKISIIRAIPQYASDDPQWALDVLFDAEKSGGPLLPNEAEVGLRAVAQSLKSSNPPKTLIPQLLTYGVDPNKDVRRSARAVLTQTFPDWAKDADVTAISAPLAEATSSTDVDCAKDALDFSAELIEKNQDASAIAPVLAGGISNPDSSVKDAAQALLTKWVDKVGGSDKASELQDVFISNLFAPKYKDRLTAIRVLEAMKPPPKTAVQALEDVAAKDVDWEVRRAAAAAAKKLKSP